MTDVVKSGIIVAKSGMTIQDYTYGVKKVRTIMQSEAIRCPVAIAKLGGI